LRPLRSPAGGPRRRDDISGPRENMEMDGGGFSFFFYRSGGDGSALSAHGLPPTHRGGFMADVTLFAAAGPYPQGAINAPPNAAAPL